MHHILYGLSVLFFSRSIVHELCFLDIDTRDYRDMYVISILLNLKLWFYDLVILWVWDFVYMTLNLSRVLYDYCIHVTDHIHILLIISVIVTTFSFLYYQPYWFDALLVLSLYFCTLFFSSLMYSCWSGSDGSILFSASRLEDQYKREDHRTYYSSVVTLWV